jgi:hypothetical protein
VDVVNRLTTVIPSVDDGTKTVLSQAQLIGDPWNGSHDVTQERGVVDGRLYETGYMPFWDDKHVHGGGGIYIRERDELFVLINNLRRNFPLDDLAKNTVLLHTAPPLIRHSPQAECIIYSYP